MLVLLMTAAMGLGDPDGVVSTAPRTPISLDAAHAPVAPTVEGAAQDAAPHGLSTDQQIDQWLASRDPGKTPYADGELEPLDDRRMHSEFSATIGTGGYRDYGAAVSMPLGENGRIGFSYRQVENGYPSYGYGPGPGPYYFDDGGYAFPGRSVQGQAWEYERRVARPFGPPMSRVVVDPMTAEE